MRVAQSAATIADTLQVAVVVRRAVVVNEIENRSGTAARAEFDLANLEPSVVGSSVNETIAVSLAAQRAV